MNRDVNRQNESPYFTIMLRWSYALMTLYYLLYMLFCLCVRQGNACIIAIPWLVMTLYGLYLTYKDPISGSSSFFIYAGILLSWTIFSVIFFGWDCGCQHLMIPLVIMFFFAVNHKLLSKSIFAAFLFILRVYLLLYCSEHETVFTLNILQQRIFLIINGLFLFISISIVCIIFSNNIQKSEKQLLQYNQILQQQAATDPLTGLPNRRYMLDLLEKHIASKPSLTFCIALGDIDFFKKVNDTLGHNCGDQALKDLAALFQRSIDKKGHVCRWGGEEFFFFFPHMNLDEANILVNDLNIAVSRLLIQHGEQEFRVTMTFGIEEYDFSSSVTELIKRADDKLYIGKESGRNQVIF